jgi:hypothetical protein
LAWKRFFDPIRGSLSETCRTFQGFPPFSSENFLDKILSLAHIAFGGIVHFFSGAPKGNEDGPKGPPEKTGSAFRRKGVILPSMEVRKDLTKILGGIRFLPDQNPGTVRPFLPEMGYPSKY